MYSRQTRSTAASSHSEASARSERYARRQVTIPTPVLPDNSETNIPDTTLRGSQQGSIRSPREALVPQGEIRDSPEREGLRRFQALRDERQNRSQDSSSHYRRGRAVETDQRMESRKMELAYHEGILQRAHEGEKGSSLSERGEKSSSLSEGRNSGQGRRKFTHYGPEARQTEWSDEGNRKRTEMINSDIMRLDQELLTPLLSPIVSDISEIKTFVKNNSDLQSMHNRALHQTQVIMKESASLIQHIHKKSMPSLEKKIEDMITESVLDWAENRHESKI